MNTLDGGFWNEKLQLHLQFFWRKSFQWEKNNNGIWDNFITLIQGRADWGNSRLSFTHTLEELLVRYNILNFPDTFSYFFHNYDITRLGNVHPITFWKYTKHPIQVSLKISTCSFWFFFKISEIAAQLKKSRLNSSLEKCIFTKSL